MKEDIKEFALLGNYINRKICLATVSDLSFFDLNNLKKEIQLPKIMERRRESVAIYSKNISTDNSLDLSNVSNSSISI